MPETCGDSSQKSTSGIDNKPSTLLHLVGILSSCFAHDARSQEHKRCTTYTDIQKRTFPPLRSKLEGKALTAKPQPYIRPGLSYPAVLSSQKQ